VAGIELDPEEPGYKHIIIRPQPPASRFPVDDSGDGNG
jgi:hypothetical protein